MQHLKNIIEAVLMASPKPLNTAKLLTICALQQPNLSKADIIATIQQLDTDYQDRGIEIKEVANGFRIQVKPTYACWVNQLFDERSPKYSRALLETLAIIVYRQPLTRAEIEDIRGVSLNSSIIKILQERGWVSVVGRKDVPGRPELLATNKTFLDYFNLQKLSDLPSLGETQDIAQPPPHIPTQLKQHEAPAEPQQTRP